MKMIVKIFFVELICSEIYVIMKKEPQPVKQVNCKGKAQNE